MTLITEPGIYNIPEDVYHSDPCPEPSLSSSIAKLMLSHSPLHAWMKHPRLNEFCEQDNKPAFDIGKAFHTMMLGEGAEIEKIDFTDYRTKDAKAARDEAYANGVAPLLANQYDEVSAMVESAKRQLKYHEDGAYFLLDGHSEQVCAWQQDDIWNRSMLDRVTLKRSIVYDLKTTTDAHPDTFMRQIVNMGYDVQAAHYLDGEKAINGHEPHFMFIVVETKPPYALCVQALTPAFLEIGRMKIARARHMFRWCLEHNRWPAFPNRTAYIDPPVFEKTKWLDEEGDPLNTNHEDMKAMFKTWEAAQAPLDGEAA